MFSRLHVYVFCVVILQILLLSSSHANNNRPTPLVEINNTTYYIGIPGLIAQANEAAQFCMDMGMKVMALETLEEFNAVYQYMYVHGLYLQYWTSGISFMEENWIWSTTGEMFTSTDERWVTGHPQAANETMCSMLNLNYLYSSPCYFYRNIVCEEVPSC